MIALWPIFAGCISLPIIGGVYAVASHLNERRRVANGHAARWSQ